VPTTNGRKGNGERRGTEGRREGKVIGQEGEGCPIQLGTVDQAVWEWREERQARRGAWASTHFFPL